MTLLVGPPLGLVQGEDRWGVPVPYWYVTNCGRITRSKWRQVVDFQTWPDIPVTMTVPGRREAIRQEIDRKVCLNPERSTIWQLDLQALDDPKDRMRVRTVIGQQHLVEWTWIDVRVLRPILVAFAGLLTKLRYNPEAT